MVHPPLKMDNYVPEKVEMQDAKQLAMRYNA